MDPRAALARNYHQEASRAGGQCRAARDQLIRQLRREDPAVWTYKALAEAVGCSQELIAYIIRSETAKG